MSVFEITEHGIQERVDAIKVPCQQCGDPARKVLRCRTVKAAYVLLCDVCARALELTAAQIGHVHCAVPGCNDAGSALSDVAELIDL